MAALDIAVSNNQSLEAKDKTDKKKALLPTPVRRVYGSVEHIRAVAWLYGLETANVAHSRTLVLGGGDEGSLLPFVKTNPLAQVISVELDTEPENVHVNRSGAFPPNLQFNRLSLADLLNSHWDPFDYIIIQESFSLLSNEITDLILSFCLQNLTPHGVIAHEWLCQPGAKSMEIMRDAIQIHSSRGESLAEQISHGREMLALLEKNVSKNSSADVDIYKQNLKKAASLSDPLFAHYFLETKNEASYLVEFNNRIDNIGLMYVGDIRPETERPDYYQQDDVVEWQTVTQESDKLMVQQYLDIAVNRHHRFSLLVDQRRAPEILEEPDYTRLKQLRWAGSFRRITPDIRSAHNTLTGYDGVTLSTHDIIVLSILDTIGDAWPYSVSYEQLVFHCRLPDDNPDSPFSANHEEKVLNALKVLFNKGIASLHIQLGCDSYARSLTHYVTVPESVVLQLQMVKHKRTLVNQWYEIVDVTSEECQQLLQPVQILTNENHTLIAGLHRKGLLTASVLGWKRYYQQVARDADLIDLGRLTCSLLLFSSDVSAGGFFTHQFESLAKATDPHVVEVVDDSIDSELVFEINGHLMRCDNKGAIALVEQERARLMKTLKGCYYLVRFYRRVADDESVVLMLVRMLSFNSTSIFIYSELSMALYQHRMFWAAGRLSRAILRCDRMSSPDWFLLGLLHTESNTLEHAEYCGRKAMELAPNSQQIRRLVGGSLCAQSKLDEGIEFLYSSIKDPLVDYYIYSQLAFIFSHSGNISVQKLLDCHLSYAKGEMAWAEQQNFVGYHPTDVSVERRLRIGFVSGDFRARHPVGFFFTPIWDQLNRECFEFYCYDNSPGYLRNEGTDHFEATADAWRDIRHTNPIELAEMIKVDQIDILVDLSGHTGHNCLSTFALKPAPVQISWIGYHATTGLPTMDYYATIFPVAKDPALEAQFTEKLIYLSLPFNFGSLEKKQTVNPLPALKNGYFTFGSFNRANKINDDVLNAWAEILMRVPTSKMVIGHLPTAIWGAVLKTMRRHGVDLDRIKLLEAMELERYLLAHHDIDLLVDTFPFTGGTVTNHAVLMGVPTISLEGETLVSRQGSSIMHSLGLSDFVATSRAQFVELAVEWSRKTEELNAIRLGLRARIDALYKDENQTSISDYVEQMFRECWRRYCLGIPPESFAVGHRSLDDK